MSLLSHNFIKFKDTRSNKHRTTRNPQPSKLKITQKTKLLLLSRKSNPFLRTTASAMENSALSPVLVMNQEKSLKARHFRVQSISTQIKKTKQMLSK